MTNGLLLTGAWNPTVPHEPAELAARRDRLLDSARHYQRTGRFARVVLVDATMAPADRRAVGAELPGVEIPELRTAPSGWHHGPSYLEALLYGAVGTAGVLGADGTIWAKATGGYRVENVGAVLDAVERTRAAGLCFLHQNPLRPWPRYAMSAFYLLQDTLMAQFLDNAAAQAEALRHATLEALLLGWFRSRGPHRVRAPYPRVDAYMSTAGHHSSHPRYALQERAWRVLSAAGLYALALPAGAARRD